VICVYDINGRFRLEYICATRLVQQIPENENEQVLRVAVIMIIEILLIIALRYLKEYNDELSGSGRHKPAQQTTTSRVGSTIAKKCDEEHALRGIIAGLGRLRRRHCNRC
jgi:hypothetical protein